MKRSRTELLDAVNAFIGDNTSDEALSLLEDITDTLTDDDGRDYEQELKDLDESWRKRYRERFINVGTEKDLSIVEDTEQTTTTEDTDTVDEGEGLVKFDDIVL